jgi:hypothetical protein
MPMPLYAGALSGIVSNSQNENSIPNVVIEIDEINQKILTDSTGAYSIDTLPAGSYNLHFFHEKFEPLTINAIFIAGKSHRQLDVSMNPVMYSLEKVVVKGHSFRRAPDMSSSTKTMSIDDIMRIPGALVDVQRAVQQLPSVASGADNTNEIIVRGGNPGENLLIMDNIEIPNANHFADQGSGGGVISLINPMLVKGLIFSAGAPPAQYGGKASSVLDVKLKEGNDRMVVGGLDIGMAGAGFHAEGPLWKGATFMASATKSYLDLFANFSEVTAIPKYRGLQAKISHSFDDHKIFANVIYGDNGIAIKDAKNIIGSDGERIDAGGKIYATGLNWEGNWNEKVSSVVTMSATGNNFDRLEYSDNGTLKDTFFINRSIEKEQMLKIGGALNLANNGKIQAGFYLKHCDFDIFIQERRIATDSSLLFTNNNDYHEIAYKYGAHIGGIFYPFQRLRVIPGIRIDRFTYNNSLTVSPRFGAVFSASQVLDFTTAFGIQYQEPDYANLVGAVENRDLKPRRALTGIIGAEYLFEKLSMKLVTEVFYKQYNDMQVNKSLTTPDNTDTSSIFLSIGKGRSYGIELFIQKKLTKNFFWTLAYSLSNAENRDVRPGLEDEWIRGDFDFRNVFTVTAGYKVDLLEKQWYKNIHDKWWMIAFSPIIPIADRVELSAKWRYTGGRPKSSPKWDDINGWVLDQQDYKDSEYPDYHRLDFRYEKRFGFGFLQMIYYFDLQNIYNKKNIWTYMYSDKNKSETPIYQFQFFPAGGVIIGF